MKLTAVTATNFLGAPRRRIELSAPIVVIAGHNGAGKSSLIEAIRFALCGQVPRGVTLKKDYGRLLTHGAKAGTVKVEFDREGVPLEIIRKVGDGKLIAGDELDDDRETLGQVLDAHAFMRLDAQARRSFLFRLLKIKAQWEVVEAELREAGLTHAEVLGQLSVMLKSGFQAAEESARSAAAQARGAWRQLTGEVYGARKAEEWTAPGADAEVDEGYAAAKADRDEAARLHRLALVELTNLESKRAAYSAWKAQQADLPSADALDDALKAVEREIADTELKIKGLEELPAPVSGTTGPCPCCGKSITYDRGRFIATPDPEKVATPADFTALQSLRGHLNGLRQKHGEQIRTNTRAESARSNAPEQVTEKQVKDATKAVQLAEAALGKAEKALAEAGADAEAVEAAKKLTADALEKHREVAAWELAEAQMKPDGVQGVLMQRGLKPLNTLLARFAGEIGWDAPLLGPDFVTRVEQTEYLNLSESEQWRVDTLFAAAIARLSGLRLLLLDRFDVLDNDGRNDLLGWLGTAGEAEFDTVIAAGTMKDKPSVLTTKFGIHVLWFDGAPAPTTATEGAPA